MAGNRNSGRRPLPGQLFRIDIRFRPDRHSPQLLELLETLSEAEPEERAAALDRLAQGGGFRRQPETVEAAETELLLEGLFN